MQTASGPALTAGESHASPSGSQANAGAHSAFTNSIFGLERQRERPRLVRKNTGPRVSLERHVQQCVAAPRIVDLVAIEIHELLATWTVAPPQRLDCTSLRPPAGLIGHPHRD